MRVWGTSTEVEGGEGVGTRWRRGKFAAPRSRPRWRIDEPHIADIIIIYVHTVYFLSGVLGNMLRGCVLHTYGALLCCTSPAPWRGAEIAFLWTTPFEDKTIVSDSLGYLAFYRLSLLRYCCFAFARCAEGVRSDDSKSHYLMGSDVVKARSLYAYRQS